MACASNNRCPPFVKTRSTEVWSATLRPPLANNRSLFPTIQIQTIVFGWSAQNLISCKHPRVFGWDHPQTPKEFRTIVHGPPAMFGASSTDPCLLEGQHPNMGGNNWASYKYPRDSGWDHPQTPRDFWTIIHGPPAIFGASSTEPCFFLRQHTNMGGKEFCIIQTSPGFGTGTIHRPRWIFGPSSADPLVVCGPSSADPWKCL